MRHSDDLRNTGVGSTASGGNAEVGHGTPEYAELGATVLIEGCAST